MNSGSLLSLTPAGLYCEVGDFHIDPWEAVDHAVVTHAHSDHARWGSRSYLAAEPGLHVLRARLGDNASITSIPFGQSIDRNGVRVSLHPAGHILGSAQVRVEHRGEVWVVSGDYKAGPDSTCHPFEPIRCDTFITESTFGLPIYRWEPQQVIFDQINAWWRANADDGKVSLLYGYALGKAQRILSGLDPSIGPILCHGAVENLNRAYRESGVLLPPTSHAGSTANRKQWARALVLAPPSAHNTPWARKFSPSSSAFASGWMTIRGTRRRRALDHGFVLSDHVDWPDLLASIAATGAERVYATHGYVSVLVRWLRDLGLDAHAIATRFTGETDDSSPDEPAAFPDADPTSAEELPQ